MCNSLLPGERPEGAPPGLTLPPAPGTLHLWGHSAAREEFALLSLNRRMSAVTQSASRLWPSQPWMWVTPESTSFLKVKVLRYHFRKWCRSPRILHLIWFSDGKVSCGTWSGRVLLACTWYLRKYLWYEETREQLDSETDQWTDCELSIIYWVPRIPSWRSQSLLDMYTCFNNSVPLTIVPMPQCLSFPTISSDSRKGDPCVSSPSWE